MRKKILILFLTIVSAVCLCIGTSACGNSDSSVNGTYYKYSDGSYDYSSYFVLKNGDWSDDSGSSGTYTVSGTTIVFYTVLFGENVEFVDGTISDGVLTYYIGSNAYTYCIDGKTPSGDTESGGSVSSQYTVTYDANGGTFANNKETYTQTVSANSTLTAPTSPTREGYSFAGWATSKNGSTMWSFSSDKVTSDITLVAVWSANEYTITYVNTDGATNTNPANYMVEDSTITLIDAVKDGYTFAGWYSDAALTQSITEIDTSSAADITIYAKWTVIEYTAGFYADGQLINSVKFTVENESITEPAVPDKTGYTGAWESYTISASDLTINAVYTPINYTITYENTKDATDSTPATYTIESEKITLADISADGYTFLGWYNGDDKVTEIATGSYGDITLTAKWEAIIYTINYEYDDTVGEIPEGSAFITSYTIEDSFEFLTLKCNVTGYTFDGWYTEKVNGTGDKVEGIALGTIGDKTYYAQWGLETYTITYHNTDDAANTNATTYTMKSSTFTIGDVTRLGYTFEGWYSDENLTVAANTTIVTGSTGDIDFYAKWSVIDYTITYNLYGGTNDEKNPDTYTIESGATLANPILSGYYFVGWYTAAENGNLVTEITKGTTGNITLYARWLAIDSNGGTDADYAVTFNVDGVTITGTPAKTYYEFSGWYTDSNLTSAYDNSLPAGSITLYAKWTPVEYTINYVLNDGTNSEDNPATYNIEDTVTFAAPSKTGYTFNGWYSDEAFTSALVEGISVGSYGEITIYANYSINQYTISFESNGGTDVAAITQNYATEVTAPADPAKNGYTFAGWYSDSSLTTAYTFTTMSAEDITLYAKWNVVTYDIVYNLDGGTNSSSNPSTYKITSSTMTLASPTKAGYTFKGWYTDSSYTTQITQITIGSYGDLELFAKWEIITYTVSYEIDTDAVNTNITEYTIETNITTLVDATLTGYTFEGWYSDSSYTTEVTTIAGGSVGNIALYGKFTATTYNVWLDGSEEASVTVTFDLNGASGTAPAAQTITETTTLTYPDVPTRNGYLFGGWYTTADCSGSPFDFSSMIGSDITLYAKWVNLNGANGIDINGTVTVTLSGTTEQVYYFIPLASGNVSITTAGSIDTLGTLYKNGTLLKQDDDSGSDSNFLITYNVTAGEVYEIRVRGFSSSTSGDITLSVSGSNTVVDGGYTRAGNKTTITYGSSDYTIDVPTTEENYKFLGWADVNGVYYTDAKGNAIRAWDIAEDTTLYSQWEKMEYTVTFVVNGGTEVASVTLEYGARLDLNLYTTTRDGYTFGGWYLSASDSESYNASTMPDENITLYAKWITYSLGSIKYDEDKLAISVYDEINAELFSALCIDTDGMPVAITVTVSGSQTAGETITVRLVATNNGKTAQKTIQNIQVYGDPTLTVTNTDIGYVNLSEMDGDWFGASGTDTFGEATTITVRVADGYSAGDIATVYIDSTDAAGNVTTQAIENVALWGTPVITYNINKTAISVDDTISANLFGATAADSFGESLTVTASLYSGTFSARNSIVILLTATDSKGNVNNTYITVNVYGAPTISDATTTDFTEGDVIEVETLGITATDSYGEELEITLSLTSGTQVGGNTMVYTATATDAAGNITANNIYIKIYGIPTLVVGRTNITINEAEKIISENLSFTVTFDSNGGTDISSQVVTKTVGLVYPAIPTRTGYAFKGWYSDSDCITLYNFTADITSDITLYAGWEAMVTSGYNLRTYVDITSKYNSSSDYYSASTSSATASYSNYIYFTALINGKYTLYYKNSLSDRSTYFCVYNVTQEITLMSSYAYSTSYMSFSINVNSGDVIYIKFNRESSNYFSTFSFYITGANSPDDGGVANVSCLETYATDSFGSELHINYILKSGEYKAGTYIVYTVVTTDKLGNVATKDITVAVYDANDIKLTYSSMASDVIKLTSTGEEFFASATDSFGNACDINIVATEGYTLTAGETISLYILATDAAGNSVYSELISGIKVYGNPTISASADYITESTDLDWFYLAYDSFGDELTTTVKIISGTQTLGDTLLVKVIASDSFGNSAEEDYCYIVGAGLSDLEYDNYVVNVNNTEKTVSIIFYNGSETEIAIPETIYGYNVTSIAEGAFKNCASITSLSVPNTVTSIGLGAFSGCSSLVSVTLPFVGGSSTENTYLGYIFGASSYSSNSSYVPSSLTTVIITGRTSIADNAFYCCSSLTSVTIFDKVSSIGSYAFYSCSAITDIIIPESIISIDGSAFYNCTSLINVYISNLEAWCNISFAGTYANPMYYASCLYLNNVVIAGNIVLSDNVTAIPYGTFKNSSVTSVTIGDKVKSIGDYAFYNCSLLTSVTIPDGVTAIGSYSFAQCVLLKDIKIADNCSTQIAAYAFCNCSNLTNITIPKYVSSIGIGAFSGCSSLINITLPFVGAHITASLDSSSKYPLGYIFGTNSYTGGVATTQYITNSSPVTYYIPSTLTIVTILSGQIPQYAFYNCSNLVSIAIPDNVSSIGDSAFYNCSSLKSITIPNSVTSIGKSAFSNCSSLKSVYYSGTASQWASISFSSNGTYYSNPVYVAGNLYLNGELATDITIENITSIRAYSFYGCKSIINITIGDSVTSIGTYAFCGCSSLMNITIGSNTTSIEAYAFRNCSSLINVTFKNTSGWYVTTTSGATSGTNIDVIDASANAIYFTSTYYNYYWYRSES